MTETTQGARPKRAKSDGQRDPEPREAAEGPLLEVRGLQKHFPIKGGALRRVLGYVKAVDGVSLTVDQGETVAIVGESGCGKSTTGRTIIRLEEPTGGEIIFRHPELGPVHVEDADTRTLDKIRPRMQFIFQDPMASLDSRMTVGRVISEPMVINKTLQGQALKDKVAELLTVVGLRPEHASRYPHAFSGGQRQRIGIARALALDPDLIICDEPVSALDVSVQAQVINLLEDLQERLGLTYLFISHDLSVVEHISDRVVVMYVGRVVEIADTKELFTRPLHPYTEALLGAVPQPDPRKRHEIQPLKGEVPSPANPPSGCYFHTRCPYAQQKCIDETPPLREIAADQGGSLKGARRPRMVSCHFAEELELTGAVVASNEAFLAVQSDASDEPEAQEPGFSAPEEPEPSEAEREATEAEREAGVNEARVTDTGEAAEPTTSERRATEHGGTGAGATEAGADVAEAQDEVTEAQGRGAEAQTETADIPRRTEDLQ
ncbi:MAG TPA: oligopeptide/dipeptide ABC transporter ATP-binding protein [Microlunatus sp.]|nr:oligopeptide/dipeptide ABC transporter ATP-binding protein [Microlunatus sp.]